MRGRALCLHIVPTTTPACRLEKVHHHYGDRVALRPLDLVVPRGVAFGVLGPNGGGKSTLLQVLATANRPTGGRLSILGLDPIADRTAIRRRLGVVFQSPAVDDHLSCAENMRHQGHLYGWQGAKLAQRIQALLEVFGLTERGDDRVGQLSGGLKRRLEIAKSLLHEPELLLMDEPCTGLDPGARTDLWDALDRLRAVQQVTVVVTTHDMEEAQRCDSLLLLHEGRSVGHGSPDALKDALGGDVLAVQAAGNVAAVAEIVRRVTGRPAIAIGDSVRVRIQGAHEWVARIVEACHDDISGVSVSRPTLGDVFLERTGHGLEAPQ